nr:DUF2933 domain-containing protein [Halomonas sp.]
MFAVGGYLLVTGHRLHFYQALPLLLLACPLMHLFMHRHHGGQQDRDNDDRLSATRDGRLAMTYHDHRPGVSQESQVCR